VLGSSVGHELARAAPTADLQQLEAEHVGERIRADARLEFEDGGTERGIEPGWLSGEVHWSWRISAEAAYFRQKRATYSGIFRPDTV
jgi:hypothetical protein